jgi:hypothetical protein
MCGTHICCPLPGWGAEGGRLQHVSPGCAECGGLMLQQCPANEGTVFHQPALHAAATLLNKQWSRSKSFLQCLAWGL